MRRLFVVALLVAACSPSPGSVQSTTTSTTSTTTTTTTLPAPSTTAQAPVFTVSSPAFEAGSTIPTEYTCEGADVSPELDVAGIPPGAESLVLIVDDPDAPLGTWDHWVEFDIPAASESVDIERGTGWVGVQGVNSWNLTGYRGPCPPDGEEHKYIFTVYALDEMLGLPEGVDSSQVYAAMEGNVISSDKLTGTFSR